MGLFNETQFISHNRLAITIIVYNILKTHIFLTRPPKPHRVKVNKAATSYSGSHRFQTGCENARVYKRYVEHTA
jgi:hypothetical protein